MQLFKQNTKTMKLNHIALTIESKEELKDFYQNILGFKLEYEYDIDANLADTIFGVSKETEVFRYSKNDLHFEFFVSDKKTTPIFTHIGVDVEDREAVATKCKKAGYKVTRVERSHKYDLLFVSDKAGNKFELKNW